MMVNCPSCGAEETAGRTECRCGADLSLLLRLDAMADAWFNCGLEAVAAGKTGRALEWVSACCAARPTDAEARRAQAKLWAQLGRAAEARAALDRAAEIDPDAPDLASVRQALEDTEAAERAAHMSAPPAAVARPVRVRRHKRRRR